jgi:hypothetical protein
MPIFVNEGYPPSPDGKEWKHVEGCRVLAVREQAGFAVRRLANRDASETKYGGHKRRRCPACMPDRDFPGTEPHNAPEFHVGRWISDLVELVRQAPTGALDELAHSLQTLSGRNRP